MKKIAIFTLASASVVMLSTASLGQTCPNALPYDEKKASAAIDRYFDNPFGVAAWRVMNGMGDPGLEPSYAGENRWTDEEAWRTLVAKIAPEFSQQQYMGYNCRIGYALSTLKARISQFGESNSYVRQWISVQSSVFRGCSDSDATITLPSALIIDASDPSANVVRLLQEQDRSYQQASLDFYLGRIDTALSEYRTIAAGTGPHRSAAKYMVANVLANAKRINDAKAEIEAILADESFSDIHPIVQELKGYLANLVDTASDWTLLIDDTVSVLEKPAAEINNSAELTSDYRRSLYDIDFLGIRAQRSDWWLSGQLPENPTLSQAVYDAARHFPLVPWLIAGQTINDLHQSAAWQIIGTNWDEKVGRYSKAAMSLAGQNSGSKLSWQVFGAQSAAAESTDSLLMTNQLAAAEEAVRSSCSTAPETAALGSLLYHTVRLMVQKGDYAGSYRVLEEFPFKSTRTFNRTVLRLGQFLLGKGLVEEGRRYRDKFLSSEFYARLEDVNGGDVFRTDFLRVSSLLAENGLGWRTLLLKQVRPADNPLLNLLPVKSLTEIAATEGAGQNFRALVSRVAWTRIYAQGQMPEATDTQEMLQLNPQISDVLEELKKTYPRAPASQLWLLTILRTPRFGLLTTASGSFDRLDLSDNSAPATQIDAYDHNDKNWWCPLNLDRLLGDVRDDFDELTGNAAMRALDQSTGFNVSGLWYRNDDLFRSVLDASTGKILAAARETVLRAHPVSQSINWKELYRLTRVSSAPKLLGERAIQWARRGGQAADGVTEALGMSVRAARYGCSWAGSHRNYTQGAVGILKTMFGDTEWARKTPYWYDCLWQSYGTDPNATVKRVSCRGPVWPKQKVLN